MGHLRVNCPNKISKPYPFNDSSVGSVYIGVNKCFDDICSPLVRVDNPQSDQLSKADHSRVSSDRAQTCDAYVGGPLQCHGRGEGSSNHGNDPDDLGIIGKKPELDTTEVQRYWELEQNSTQVHDVQGRLKSNLIFWKEVLQAPVPIIETVSEGYKLPLLSLPPTYERRNQSSAHQHADFVSSAITELLQNRCIQKVAFKPHICSPLSVVSNNSGKLRLVLNLRYLNQFLWKEKFKYEDLRVAMLMFQPDDYMFTFDLKSGYHHIDIHIEHWKYLGFAWGEGSAVQYYVFCVLPFGLATACYVPLYQVDASLRKVLEITGFTGCSLP